MTDTIEIEILPFADFIIDLGSMSPPEIPEVQRSGHGLVESVDQWYDLNVEVERGTE